MPVVFRTEGVRFYFFSNEGSPREPVHIHVEGKGGEAKLWMLPEVGIAESTGFNQSTQAHLVELAEERREDIMRAWHDHFG